MQAVIQIARKLGVRTVNVVRERDDDGLDELRGQLTEMGADHVLTEQELRKSTLFRDKEIPRWEAVSRNLSQSDSVDSLGNYSQMMSAIFWDF